jgi:hypothetical protein
VSSWSTQIQAEDLVLDDLGTHTLSTVESRRILLAGNQTWPLSLTGPATTLEVLPGGDAAGGISTDRFGRLRILGGTISGTISTPPQFPEHGIDIEMTGGSFQNASMGGGIMSISGGSGQLLQLGYGGPAICPCQLTMTGGTLQQFHPLLTGRANLSSGTVSWVNEEAGAEVTISGANVGSVSLGGSSAYPAKLFVTGGSVGPVTTLGIKSYVTVSGGQVIGPVSCSLLEIRGIAFSVPFGDYTNPTFSQITGMLADGSALDLHFTMVRPPMGSSLLRVVQVPEPGALLYFLPAVSLLARRMPRRSSRRRRRMTRPS